MGRKTGTAEIGSRDYHSSDSSTKNLFGSAKVGLFRLSLTIMRTIIVKYSYTNSSYQKKSPATLAVFLVGISVIPISCILLLSEGLRIQSDDVPTSMFAALSVIQVLFVIGIMCLLRTGYRGSYVLLAATILLTGIGMVLQIRLSINTISFSVDKTVRSGMD